jgi:uncharacterized protein YbjT (DUF2867 family)
LVSALSGEEGVSETANLLRQLPGKATGKENQRRKQYVNILVLGGTGTVGSQVVNELLARDVDVRVLTRSTEKAQSLPEGAEGVIGDLLEPETVRSVFGDTDSVFLLAPVSLTETSEGLMALNGIRSSGVKRLVYLSVHNLEAAPHLPHFGPKLAIEAAIKHFDIPYTILRPNNYYQNDYLFKDVLLEYGVYPQPIGDVGCSRVDVRDIAEAAAIVLTTGEHDGQTYNLVGPDVHTGQSTAEAWSHALGQSIEYGGNDLDAWEQQFLQYMPAWMVFDFKLMYAFFQEKGLKATPDDIERQTELIGHAPRSFEDFAKEAAEMWEA